MGTETLGSSAAFTALLRQWHEGDAQALGELLEQAYPELRRIARNHLRRERNAGSLAPTALVHEAYVRLVDQAAVDWEGRRHFLAVASRTMRRLLVEIARARRARKRDAIRVSLREDHAEVPPVAVDVLDLAAALEKLEGLGHETECRVVELRYFAGLSVEEVAAELGIGHATVSRAWSFARAWLHRELARPSSS